MEFFDLLIDSTLSLLEDKEKRTFAFSEDKICRDEGHSGIILQRDCAYELKGTGFNLVSSRSIGDGVILYGKDLHEIKKDCTFARISLIETDFSGDEQKAYELIRKIEYVKYHCFPEGYMMRSSSDSSKEAVRVSKAAIKKGIDFQCVGNLLISKYKEIPGVKSAKVIFVTDEAAPYGELKPICEKASAITKALNHIMENLEFDCESCNLKPLCDEVEGMRELHFKSAGRM